jgi:hypothetical protein
MRITAIKILPEAGGKEKLFIRKMGDHVGVRYPSIRVILGTTSKALDRRTRVRYQKLVKRVERPYCSDLTLRGELSTLERMQEMRLD